MRWSARQWLVPAVLWQLLLQLGPLLVYVRCPVRHLWRPVLLVPVRWLVHLLKMCARWLVLSLVVDGCWLMLSLTAGVRMVASVLAAGARALSCAPTALYWSEGSEPRTAVELGLRAVEPAADGRCLDMVPGRGSGRWLLTLVTAGSGHRWSWRTIRTWSWLRRDWSRPAGPMELGLQHLLPVRRALR